MPPFEPVVSEPRPAATRGLGDREACAASHIAAEAAAWPLWASWCGAGLACAALALAGVFALDNPDTFGHLAQGRQIAELGHVPSHDSFSFFRTAPAIWHNYEWLSDLVTWLAYASGGPNALIALKCLVLMIAGGLLTAFTGLLAGRRAALACALLLLWTIPAARFRFAERPHLVALPFSALYLIGLGYLLRAFGQPSQRKDLCAIAGLALLHVAWVNLHGSHLLGLILTGLHFACGAGQRDARVRLGSVLGLQLLASCVSPYGPAIVLDALAHVLDPRYRALVPEWEPWKAGDPTFFAVALMLQTAALCALVRPLWRSGPAGRALLLCSCVLALAAMRSIRFLAEYLLIASPAIAIGVSRPLAALSARKLAIGAGLYALLALAGAAFAAPRLPPYRGLGLGTRTTLLPAASGQWLREHARAPRVLATIEDAWYLMFAVPQARFLVDGRVPFYGAEHIARVREAFADPRALSVLLVQDRVDTVLVRHTFAPHRNLLQSMRGNPAFVLASMEDRYSLFVKRDLPLRAGAVEPLTLEGYDLEWLVSADAARERAILSELARLPAHENVRGYQSFVRAVLALKPLLRPGKNNGIEAPRDPASATVLARVQPWLERAARGAEGVPLVHAYHALVAAARCDLPAADQALEQAREEGDSRETLLGAQEIALRRGDRAAVQAFLAQASALPGAADDGWLAALAAGMAQAPPCP